MNTTRTLTDLIEFIDKFREDLSKNYDDLFYLNRGLIDAGDLDKMDKVHLEWYGAHIHTETILLSQKLKQMQKVLHDAGKKIQD